MPYPRVLCDLCVPLRDLCVLPLFAYLPREADFFAAFFFATPAPAAFFFAAGRATFPAAFSFARVSSAL